MGKTKTNKQIMTLVSGILVAFFIALISGMVIITVGSDYITPVIPVHLMTFITMSGVLVIASLINFIFKGFRKR